MEALKGAAVTLNMAANAELRVRLWGWETASDDQKPMKPAPSKRPRASTRLLSLGHEHGSTRCALSFKPPLSVPPLSTNAAQVRSALRHNDVCRERFAVGRLVTVD